MAIDYDKALRDMRGTFTTQERAAAYRSASKRVAAELVAFQNRIAELEAEVERLNKELDRECFGG